MNKGKVYNCILFIVDLWLKVHIKVRGRTLKANENIFF